MNVLDAYQIPIISLEDKAYRYTFEGNDAFFAAFEQDWVQRGDFHAVVDLAKSATMIQIQLEINGHIRLTCDRSLEEFDYPFQVKEKVIYKYSDHSEDLGDNLFLIDRKESRLDLIALQVPMKKLHPRYISEAEAIDGDIFIYTTEKELTEEEIKKQADEVDPRWAALKKLKDNT